MPKPVTLIRVSITLALFTLVILSPDSAVYAQALLEQPFFGFAWPTPSIPVMVQNVSNPPYANSVVLTAMNTWNAAQEWFVTNFEQGHGTPYTFHETNISYPSMVKVTFGPIQTDDWGYTYFNYNLDSQGHFTNINVTIVLDTVKVPGESALQALVMHELGHALGLAHTTFSTDDLMNHLAPGSLVIYPSSLNLYGLFLLSKANSSSTLPPNPVTLPSSISYGNYFPPQESFGRCSANITCIAESNASITGPGFSQNTAYIHLSSYFQNLRVYVNLTIPKAAVSDINRVRIFANNTLPQGSSQEVTMNATHYFLYFIFPYTFAPNTLVELEVHQVPNSAPALNYAGLLATVLALLAIVTLVNKRSKKGSKDRTRKTCRMNLATSSRPQ